MKLKNNLIQNTENYYGTLKNPTSKIFELYAGLVIQYITLSGESIYMQNTDYLKFVLKRGLDTLSHVFNILLLFTRNLELTVFHSQKAFYYYVEFIGQIGDDNHTFLQLNSKDASLFVYKKTIFDINNENKKAFNENDDDSTKHHTIKLMVKIYNKLICSIIDNNDFPDENNVKLLKEINGPLSRIVENMVQCIVKDKTINNMNNLEYLVTNIMIKMETNEILKEKYLRYIELLVKKLRKKNVSLKSISMKFQDTDFDNHIKNNTILKFVNWLCNNKN